MAEWVERRDHHDPRVMTAQLTSTLSPTVLNEFRYWRTGTRTIMTSRYRRRSTEQGGGTST